MRTISKMIVYVAGLVFERRLTDMSGGNISVREDNCIYMTPRYSGSKKHWRLQPEDILCGPLDTDDLLQNPLISREAKAHMLVYRNYPDVHGVIHAHPLHVLPFCVAGKPIPPVLEATQKFGVVDLVEEAPAHSLEIAENVVKGLRGKEDRIRAQAAAVLLPRHGILVAAKDLYAAVDALERIDWNAYCILVAKALE